MGVQLGDGNAVCRASDGEEVRGAGARVAVSFECDRSAKIKSSTWV